MDADAFELKDKTAAFATYEEYLDSHISELDMFMLEDEDLCRQLIGSRRARARARSRACPHQPSLRPPLARAAELGYRGTGDVLKRDEFEARKRADREKHMSKDVAPKPLASMGKDLAGKPLLQALAAREELVRNGKLTCIIFLRNTNSKGQEISGYIDYAHR